MDHVRMRTARAGLRACDATVIALVNSPDVELRIGHGLRGRATVVRCQHREQMTDLALRAPAKSAVFTELWDTTGAPTAPAVRVLRAALPSLPIIAYYWPTQRTSEQLLAIANAGANAFVLRGVDDIGAALEAVLAGARAHGIAQHVIASILPSFSAPASHILEYCLANAHLSLTVNNVANALGVHRKTLVNQLARAGLAGPRHLIVWSRILAVVSLLQDPGRTVEQVSYVLDYPSPTALRNVFRRYLHSRPTAFRDGKGLSDALDAFRTGVLRRIDELGTSQPQTPAMPDSAPCPGLLRLQATV